MDGGRAKGEVGIDGWRDKLRFIELFEAGHRTGPEAHKEVKFIVPTGRGRKKGASGKNVFVLCPMLLQKGGA